MATTADAGFSAEFEGAASDLEATCEDLGQDAVVVFIGEQATVRSDTLAPVLRGWCGIAVAAEDPQSPLDANAVNTLIQKAKAQNVPLWIIGNMPRSAVESVILFGQTYEYLEPTLFKPPNSWVGLRIFLTASRPE
jgi:MinD-like ATPase involved in chromosome partitioning or flagellar assembly